MLHPRQLALIAVAGGFAFGASAQQAPSQPNAVLEQIVVTAERVATDLQKTPISVLQVSGEEMYNLGVQNIRDLAKFMPNVSIGPSSQGGEPNFSIRGISQIRTGIAGDRSVGFYVDGQYFPRTTGSLMRALDIANVEVLRGPQGTLFGRNNTGGAISITTNKPQQDFGGHIRLGLGDYDRRNLDGVVNVPITDGIAFRGSVASYNRDGYVQGQNGQTRGNVDDLLWRTAFRFDLTQKATLDLAYTDINSKKTGFPMTREGHVNPNLLSVLACQLNGPCPTNPGQFVHFPGTADWIGIPFDMDTPYTDSFRLTNDPFSYVGGIHEFNNTDTRFVNATINWQFADHLSLRSISGGMKIGNDALRDADGTPWDIGKRGGGLRHQSWSQELHLIGDGYFDGHLNFLTGLYRFHERNRETSWSRSYGALGFLPFSYTNPPGMDSLTFGLQPGQSFPFYAIQAPGPGGAVTFLPPGSTPGSVVVPQGSNLVAVCPLYYPFAGTLQRPQPLADGSSTKLVGCVDRTRLGMGPLDHSGEDASVDSRAIFGDVTVNATDKLTLSAGLRYTRDDKSWFIEGASTNFGDIIGTKDGEWHSSDWRFATQYQWTPAIMTYLTVDTAYKAGGLNDSIPFGYGGFGYDRVAAGQTLNPITGEAIDSPFIPFNPEHVTNHEIGLRSEWFDHRFRANASIFDMDYKDKQQSVFIRARRGHRNTPYAVGYGSGSLIINASEVTISGIETEFTLAPTDSVTLGLDYAHLNAGYTKLDPLLVASDTLTLDTPLPRAPKYSYTFQVQYHHAMLGGFGAAQIAYAVKGKQYSGSGKTSQWMIPALGLINARLAYTSANRDWTAALSVRNLTDKFYLNGGFSLSTVTGIRDFYAGGSNIIFPGQPREVSLDFTYNFGR